MLHLNSKTVDPHCGKLMGQGETEDVLNIVLNSPEETMTGSRSFIKHYNLAPQYH